MTILVVGGAGFIGSHLVKTVMGEDPDVAVRIFDNFSSGREWHLAEVAGDPRLAVVRGDVKDLPALQAAMRGADAVYHFASNPDIARAVTEPDVDFWEGTYLTNNVAEAMRREGVRRVLYASGSGLYGDTGEAVAHEDWSPLRPISTYGASKLAGEVLFCSYCHMFGLVATAFRFANVVGPHQTHGVGFDFVKRLLADPTRLRILGDGTQNKSYLHVHDVIAAMRLCHRVQEDGFATYNVATEDLLTVSRIADLSCEVVGVTGVRYEYTGGNRGWKGDVPVVRLDSSRIRALGWKNRFSAREAMRDALVSMLRDARAGKL